GFDILGGLKNLTGYQDNVLLNLTTAGLIIFGGLGFLVIMDLIKNRSFKKLCLHSKAVIVTTLILLASGTILIWLTEDITWLGAFFTSVSARTAGFSTFPLGEFTSAGLLSVSVLMFIGASPGSTGGGIKTSTLFTLFHTIKGAACNEEPHAFHYRIPQEAFYKAAIVTALSALVVCLGTFFMCILEPGIPFEDILFEITSAFGTVGLSTGITPGLSSLSKLLEVLVMYIGRLGPLTIVTIWVFKPTKSVSYAEGSISIG
ncbi:potassium transporter TrkG, partial [Enterocloster bolteae]|uniref:potassium transporter TrkG n=2 Tax=Lachnospiraceae TaxID=186803 RepID=UPI002A7F80F5